jgi:hypothetical protein
MSVPQQKLASAEIPGYYLYWMLGNARVEQALRAGYEFVGNNEGQLNNVSLGGDAKVSGNTDMGSRVSVVAGDELDTDGQPKRLYLMKLKEEWRQEDLALQQQGNEKFVATLRAGRVGAEKDAAADVDKRYVGSQTKADMFVPKPLRRS